MKQLAKQMTYLPLVLCIAYSYIFSYSFEDVLLGLALGSLACALMFRQALNINRQRCIAVAGVWLLLTLCLLWTEQLPLQVLAAGATPTKDVNAFVLAASPYMRMAWSFCAVIIGNRPLMQQLFTTQLKHKHKAQSILSIAWALYLGTVVALEPASRLVRLVFEVYPGLTPVVSLCLCVTLSSLLELVLWGGESAADDLQLNHVTILVWTIYIASNLAIKTSVDPNYMLNAWQRTLEIDSAVLLVCISMLYILHTNRALPHALSSLWTKVRKLHEDFVEGLLVWHYKSTLTADEAKLLTKLLHGATNQTLSETFGVSSRTISERRKRLLDKLDLGAADFQTGDLKTQVLEHMFPKLHLQHLSAAGHYAVGISAYLFISSYFMVQDDAFMAGLVLAIVVVFILMYGYLAVRQHLYPSWIIALATGVIIGYTLPNDLFSMLEVPWVLLLLLAFVAMYWALCSIRWSVASSQNIENALYERFIKQLQEGFGLSAQELVVAEELSAGNSAKTIADKLFIAPSTVETHRKHIYQKLGVHSQLELMSLFEKRRF